MATNMLQIADMTHQATWAMCLVCDGKFTFENPRDFVRHLRSEHCTKEGGSFVCRYGRNGVCQSLPVEGVSDVDYEAHVQKHHVGVTLQNGKLWSICIMFITLL
jgi:vacuolar protein sorting-associated protein 54